MVPAKYVEMEVKEVPKFLEKHLGDEAVVRTYLIKPPKTVPGHFAIYGDIPIVKEEGDD